MRRSIILCLALLLCLPFVSYAASIGGAETEGKGNVAIGLDQEFGINRDMKSGGTSWLNNEYINDVKIDNLNRTMLKASYGILDNFDIYVRLGAAMGRGEDKEYANVGAYEGKENYKYKDTFAYGIGIKGTCPLKNGWLLGVDLQYLRQKNSLSDRWEDVRPSHDADYTGKAVIQEWHVAPYVAKKIGNFIPYLGAKYSDLRVNMALSDNESQKYKAKYNAGVFLGADYIITGNWKLNIEGRFVDETAVSFGATYKF